MPNSPRLLKIFLASSSDVRDVRLMVKEVVEAIGHDPHYCDKVRIELLRWEDADRPTVMDALHTPQDDVRLAKGEPWECDLLIGLFRHRFGLPLPVDRYGEFQHGAQRQAWRGTQWEVMQAIEDAERRAGQPPVLGRVRSVLLFRDTSPWAEDPALDEDANHAAYEQHRALKAFLKTFEDTATGTIRRGLNPYAGPQAFKEAFNTILRKWISRFCAELNSPVAPAASAAPQAAAPVAETLTPEHRPSSPTCKPTRGPMRRCSAPSPTKPPAAGKATG